MSKKVREHFLKSFDGTKISYRVAGNGKKVILCFNGIGVSKWVWGHLEDYFADKYTIVTWDYRGHGNSGNPPNAPNVNFREIVEDAVNLVNYLGLKKACLIGHSVGLHVALETHRKFPKLATEIISCLGTPGKTLESFMDSFVGQIVFDVSYILNAFLPDMAHWINKNLLRNPFTYQIGAALRLVNPAIEGKKELMKYLRNITDMDFMLFNEILATSRRLTAEDLLPKLKVPTLLIACEYDRFVPLKIAEDMHKSIKKSELFVIKNGTHAALLEQPDIFNLCIERFLIQTHR